MLEIIFPFVGGIGLFLLGMMLLSNGLIGFGGSTIKQGLARFTGTPAKAFVSGTLATLVLQSSSATTVTLIGFVSAGLISFTQAIGVVIGASLGNTATGWVVAGLGLKVSLGFYTLPLIGIGAMLKLLAKGRLGELGMAAAGFGLMFLGLNTLQQGMSGLADDFSFASLPLGGYGARFAIMFFGLALTALLQSSTAAIATTLTALHTHTINFDQAAALVVGAAIGTTITGALVAIGSTVHAKRTALAYSLFNAVTGVLAIILLPLFHLLIDQWELPTDVMALVAFHTIFISIGVLLFLPFVAQYARLVERLLPEPEGMITQRLDASLLALPAVALEAAQRALERVALRLLDIYDAMLSGTATSNQTAQLLQTAQPLQEIYEFTSRIELKSVDAPTVAQRVAQLHAIDHLLRLRGRLQDMVEAEVDLTEPCYLWAQHSNKAILRLARDGMLQHDMAGKLQELEQCVGTLTGLSHAQRHAVLSETLKCAEDTADTLKYTDTFRWLDRTGQHIWRVCHYLSKGRPVANSRVDAT